MSIAVLCYGLNRVHFVMIGYFLDFFVPFVFFLIQIISFFFFKYRYNPALQICKPYNMTINSLIIIWIEIIFHKQPASSIKCILVQYSVLL